MARTPTSEIFKDRRVQIVTASVVGLLVVAGGAFYFLSSGSGGGGDTQTATNGAGAAAPGGPGAPGAPNPGMPVGRPVPGSPVAAAGNPGSPLGAPGAGSAAPRPGAPKTAAVAALDSWSGAPASFGAGGGAAGAAATAPGGAPGAGAGGAGGGALPPPITPGAKAEQARMDPFVTTRKFVVERIPAFTFLAPFRLALRPKPAVPDLGGGLLKPNEMRPLPPVQRRVAGVLYDGSTSAIVETGQPGPDADVRVVQPGSTVPSGIAGLADLTVSVITPTQVTLRANDGRTVTVPLSNLPPAIADQLRTQAAQQAGQGAGGPGGPGFGPGGPPPGAFGPGGPPGMFPGGPKE